MPNGLNKKIFTEVMLERIGTPKKDRLELRDEACPGLVLRVTNNGVKSFSVIYKVLGEGGLNKDGRLLTGSQHRVTIGRWPNISLKDAREKAREIITAAAEGRDVRLEMRDQNKHRFANTIEAVLERFIELHAKPNNKSWKNVEAIMRLHVLPKWKGRVLSDIRRSDVHELLDEIVETGKIGTAREVRKNCSKLFNWSADREIIRDNPMFGMVRKELRAPLNAGRALEPDELKAIWAATYELGYPFGPLYKLLILTGQRRNEWANTRRSEINLEDNLLEIPASRYKGKRDHFIPLTEVNLDIVKALPAWSGNDYYLFSTKGGRIPVLGFSRAKIRLDRETLAILNKDTKDKDAELKKFRIHDFRVTCETRLAKLGFAQEIRDAVLGHAKPGLQKTYNKYDYLVEKRTALEAYEKYLLEIVR